MISVIVPAYNEEKHIAETLLNLRKNCGRNAEIIAIDDGSRDKTGERAAKYARVIRNKANLGKGESMRLGARKAGGDTLVFIDASQFDAAEVPKLVSEFKRSKADMIIGSRDPRLIPWPRKITNSLTKLAILLGTGRLMSDALSGFRVVGKKDFLSLKTTENRYAIEAEMNFKALFRSWKIREVPVSVSYERMPSMRLGSTRTSLPTFFNQRFFHEAVFNIKSVLKLWFLRRL